MKLQEAYDLSNLRTAGQQPILREKTKSAIDLAEELFAEAEERGDPFIYLTPHSWSRKWLPSKKFRLVRLPLNACALPCQPKGRNLVLKKIHAREEKPIIVDYNVNQVGKAMHGYTPQVIVIDGKHRFTAATIRGESHINAWVGEAAIELIPSLQAMGSGGGPAPDRLVPAKGAALVGGKFNPPTGMNKSFSVPNKGNMHSKSKKKMRAKGIKLSELDVDKIEAEYLKACNDGYKGSMKASAPPGCEDAVQGLKKKYGEGSSKPFAIAWWMKNNGRCGE